MPGLTLPFALVGAAAGMLSAGVLINPLVDSCRAQDRAIAPFATLVVGALLGRFLEKRLAPRDLFVSSGATNVRLFFAVVVAAIAAGASTGGLATPSVERLSYGVAAGAGAGALFGLAFFPVCSAVLAAAHRAVRARSGSIVADSDRRAVWIILSAALAASTVLAVPDWPAAVEGLVPGPYIAHAIALGAGAVIALLSIADVLALRRIGIIAGGAATMEARRPDSEDNEGAPRVDLGLGEEVLAKTSRGSAAYRERERTLELLVGSVRRARSEIKTSLRRNAIGLAVVGAALLAHEAANTTWFAIEYREARCERGSLESCRVAAAMLWETETSLAEMERGFAALRFACGRGDRQACDELPIGFARGSIH